MPVYEEITIKDLDDLLHIIDHDLGVAIESHLPNLVSYCIVLLYEYCVCISHMRLYAVSYMKKTKATIDTIKHYIGVSNQQTMSLLNSFMQTRNALCHITALADSRKMIKGLLSEDRFYVLLGRLEVTQEILSNLRRWYSTYYTDSFTPFDSVDYTLQKVGDEVNLSPTVSASDCETPEDFNPFDYIRQKVGDKVNLLANASVCNCKTPEDCQDLIDSLAHLL